MTTGEILILSEKSLAQGDRRSRAAANLAPRGALWTPCEIHPVNERKLRPLAEPEQQCEVWVEAVRSADWEGEPAGATTGGWPGVPGG
jgi:hypothetical protein